MSWKGKLAAWLVGLFALYYILTQPVQAGNDGQSALGAIGDGFGQIGIFLGALFG